MTTPPFCSSRCDRLVVIPDGYMGYRAVCMVPPIEGLHEKNYCPLTFHKSGAYRILEESVR